MDTDRASLTHFWSLTPTELFHILKTSEHGLTHNEAATRVKQYGTNELKTRQHYNLFIQIFKKITNPLVLILIFSSCISALLGELTELAIILIILFVSILVDSLQEHKANKAAEELRAHVQVTTNTLRDGTYKELALGKLVPGDIVKLTTGDIVPADCRILSSESLMVSQSSLTGESLPAEKRTIESLPLSTELTARQNCLFMGTTIVSGSAIALIAKTGTHTEYGTIATKLSKPRPETEFETGSRKFGVLISQITFALVMVVFVINSIFRHNVLDAFLFSLAIAIGMTPELLPVIISINLARGGQRMAKRNVIVKELPAIEIFGSMDILCTDKTGTLTQDEIRLERFENANQKEDESVITLGVVHSQFQSGITNPIEKAILTHRTPSHEAYAKIAELPFDFSRRLSSVVIQHDQHILLISKGAPEAIIARCTTTTTEKKHLLSRFEELSKDGFRVLALAQKKVSKATSFTHNDENHLQFVGFMAFFDPPKNGAHEALVALEKQGVTVKILTGDSELVTQKVCDDLGLPILGICTGDMIEKQDDAQLRKSVETTTIFARLTPAQKERVILALKTNGHVVGYIGDGMNDTTSLRAADVGISVNNAIDAAKETADIILMHKSLRVLHEGVMEGRRTYQNIMKYILMGTSSNLGNMMSMTGASLFLPFLPMLPVQILLNNLLYDLSELVIPSDNVDEETIELPKKWDVTFIKKFTIVFGPVGSLFDYATFGLLLLFKAPASLFQTVWFMTSFFSQVAIIFVIRTHRVPFFRSNPSNLLISSSLCVALFALLLPLTPLRVLFGFTSPTLSMYVIVMGITTGYVVLAESLKMVFYRRLN